MNSHDSNAQKKMSKAACREQMVAPRITGVSGSARARRKPGLDAGRRVRARSSAASTTTVAPARLRARAATPPMRRTAGSRLAPRRARTAAGRRSPTPGGGRTRGSRACRVRTVKAVTGQRQARPRGSRRSTRAPARVRSRGSASDSLPLAATCRHRVEFGRGSCGHGDGTTRARRTPSVVLLRPAWLIVITRVRGRPTLPPPNHVTVSISRPRRDGRVDRTGAELAMATRAREIPLEEPDAAAPARVKYISSSSGRSAADRSMTASSCQLRDWPRYCSSMIAVSSARASPGASRRAAAVTTGHAISDASPLLISSSVSVVVGVGSGTRRGPRRDGRSRRGTPGGTALPWSPRT